MRRLVPLAAVLVLTLAGCGQVTTSTTVEKRNLRTMEMVPEAKARSVRPVLKARYDAERGLVVVAAAKELTGELYRFEAYDEATVTVKSRQPELVGYAVANVALFGLPLALATVDDHARDDVKKAVTATEISRGEKVMYRVDDTGDALGRDGVTLKPWKQAAITYALEEAAPANGTTDAAGVLEIPPLKLVDDGAQMLDRDSLSFRAQVTLNAQTVEQALYLGPRDVASMRGYVGRAAREEAKLALRAGDLKRAAARMKVSAVLGDDGSQFDLSQMYHEGRGVPQNRAEMMKWLVRAARQGNAEAQLELAAALAEGPERNDVEAYYWSLLAASQGGEGVAKRAMAKRDELARRLAARDVDRTQAQAIAFTPAPEVARVNAQGQTMAAVFETVPPLDPSARKGRAKPDAVALVIGVEDYAHLPPAQFAARDARSFRDFAIQGLGIPASRVRLLVDNDARGLDVQRAIDTWLVPHIQGGATDVYVFFSGHGLASEDGRGLFLFPQDGDRTVLAKSAIDRRAVIDAVLKAGARSATLFLDTCYSGGTRGDDTLVADARPALLVARDGEVPWPAAVLAAAQGDQLSSSYAPARHGLYSYFLMRGLMGEADGDGDHAVTLAEMERYLQANVRREASRKGRQQNPVLAGDGSKVLISW
ncbi:MAG: caspase family protein [Bacteroidales bacterium]